MKSLIITVNNIKYSKFCDIETARELAKLYGCTCAPELSVGTPCMLILRDINLGPDRQWHQPFDEWFHRKNPGNHQMKDYFTLYI